MSEIKSFNDYANKYNTNFNYSVLFNGGAPSIESSACSILSDYAMIKNGSYGKLLKAYYAKQDADKMSQTGDSSKTLTIMRSSADSLEKSADALNNDALWEKKKIKKKDGETEIEDYDWNAITKAVKSFIDDYNSVVEEAGNSDTKNVLRNAVWMTNMTDKSKNLLSQVGITVGKGNKLELDEDALKKANMTTLKSLFTGYGSFADKIARKASSISNAAARTRGVDITYTKNGAYSNTISKLFSSMVDEKVGDKDKDKDKKKDSEQSSL